MVILRDQWKFSCKYVQLQSYNLRAYTPSAILVCWGCVAGSLTFVAFADSGICSFHRPGNSFKSKGRTQCNSTWNISHHASCEEPLLSIFHVSFALHLVSYVG